MCSLSCNQNLVIIYWVECANQRTKNMNKSDSCMQTITAAPTTTTMPSMTTMTSRHCGFGAATATMKLNELKEIRTVQPYFSAIPCSVSDWSKLWRMKTSLFRTWLQVLPYFFNWRAESRIDCLSLNKLSFSITCVYWLDWCCCGVKLHNDGEDDGGEGRNGNEKHWEIAKTNNIYLYCMRRLRHYYTIHFDKIWCAERERGKQM